MDATDTTPAGAMDATGTTPAGAMDATDTTPAGAMNATDTILSLIRNETSEIRRRLVAGESVDARIRAAKDIIADCPAEWDYSSSTFIRRDSCYWPDTPRNIPTKWVPGYSGHQFSGIPLDTLNVSSASDRNLAAIKAIIDRGFILAGGAVSSMLTGSPINDLDIFAPGMTPEEAESKFSSMVDELAAHDLFKNCCCQTYRTNNCITAIFGTGVEIQLITRTYRNVLEIVYGFDLAPCAVAWDGKKITATIAAEYAYRTGVFTPDMSVRRLTFEARICKYVFRGFALVLPCTTASAVCTHTSLNLYKSEPRYRHAGDPDNMILIDEIQDSARVATDTCDPVSAYGSLAYRSFDELAKFNVLQILRGNDYLVWDINESPPRICAPKHWDCESIVEDSINLTSVAGIRAGIERIKALGVAAGPALYEFAITGEHSSDGSTNGIADAANRIMRAMDEHSQPPPWKLAEDGTDLNSGFVMTLPTSEFEWYGNSAYVSRKAHDESIKWVASKLGIIDAARPPPMAGSVSIEYPAEWESRVDASDTSDVRRLILAPDCEPAVHLRWRGRTMCVIITPKPCPEA
jgi:hypothetical protein